MIRLGAKPALVELFRGGLHVTPGNAIDDSRFLGVTTENLGQLIDRPIADQHLVGQVRSIKGTDQQLGFDQPQLPHDIFTHPLGRRGGVGVDRHAWKRLLQQLQLTILRPEVVAPLADAVRFVNRHQRHIRLLQCLEHPWQD